MFYQFFDIAKMTTEEAYRAYYQKLNRFFTFLKELTAISSVKLPTPPKIAEERNQRLADLFSQSNARTLCGNCRGQCCYQDGSPLYLEDLLRILAKNPEFSFPEPDYEYLKADTFQKDAAFNDTHRNYKGGGFKCIFLGRNGCILERAHRPKVCIEWRCESLCEILKKADGYSHPFQEAAFDAILKNKYALMSALKEGLSRVHELKNFSDSEKEEFCAAIDNSYEGIKKSLQIESSTTLNQEPERTWLISMLYSIMGRPSLFH
jgi:Fe-S-cluster containining protein